MDADTISKTIDDMYAAYSRGDLEGFVASFADNVILEENSENEPVKGRAAFKDTIKGWINVSSNCCTTPVRKLISGNEAVVEVHYEATHDRGEIFGLAPTGKRIVSDYVAWLSFEGDRIRSVKAFRNPLVLMRQIGAE